MPRSVLRSIRSNLLDAAQVACAMSSISFGLNGCSSSATEPAGAAIAGGSSTPSGSFSGAPAGAGGSNIAAGGSVTNGGTRPTLGAGASGQGGASNASGGSTFFGSAGTATANGGRGSGTTAASGSKATSGGTTASMGGSSNGGSSNGGSSLGGSQTSGGVPGGGSSNANGGRANGGATARGGATAVGGNSAGSGGCLDGPALVVPAGYRLVWSDEFNVDGAPDPRNWGYENGFVRNEEAQWYQPNNAWVEKGCLIIEGRRERKANPNYQAGSSSWKTNRQYAEYTSSSLHTSGKRSWQYGRFEMRGRIKTKPGLWPAWWTLGVSGEWPSNGEIDIMEYYAGMVRANVACGTTTRWQAKWDGAAWNVATFEDKQWESKFHVWRMDWNSTKIDLYLDDKLVNTSNLSDMLNPDGKSPFTQPHYMLVNLAIGGNNGGDPSGTAFPTRYEVDYIRVFQTE